MDIKVLPLLCLLFTSTSAVPGGYLANGGVYPALAQLTDFSAAELVAKMALSSGAVVRAERPVVRYTPTFFSQYKEPVSVSSQPVNVNRAITAPLYYTSVSS